MPFVETVEVEYLRKAVNYLLANDAINTADHRMGAITLLESALMRSGNYHGFRYLTTSEVPTGQLPGIINHAGVPTFPDDSRRYYH